MTSCCIIIIKKDNIELSLTNINPNGAQLPVQPGSRGGIRAEGPARGGVSAGGEGGAGVCDGEGGC